MAPGDVYKEYSEFYDLYVGDRFVDLPFYLDYARSAQTPVIEIGAGTGRLTLPLARAGVRMVALDVSTSMLAILKSRLAEETSAVRSRIEVVEADASELKLGIRSDVIMRTGFILRKVSVKATQWACTSTPNERVKL